ncbi:DNA cytosine methyltransferase [Parabacteroides sp.]|uniref:DNA cytosine methyltransferase n=1 Tax=unclassified Parabacteroides TaxID=2649774 RepID=UPI0026DF2AC2|nr:DNA (cytosine-5-)-methyltransferase [Parabacteroides sp.]MDO5430121.1 DNA (cytosine-5-)-methyltransferase [Parabacteroides sp.]
MRTIKKTLIQNSINTLSLFSGAGGLDIGAIQAGAKIIWANDMMKDACDSYSTNIGEHIYQGDINSYISSLGQYKGNIDLVIGGPPCQGFSIAGKMDEDDERSKLIWSYVKVLETVMPKAFIMENVKALGTLERWSSIRCKLLNKIQALGYSVNFCILNASDYDVPQARERIFVIGFKGNNFANPNLEVMLQPYKRKAKTVRESLKVLDKAGTGNNISTCNAKITLTNNPVLRKSAYAGMLFNGLGRPLKLDGYSATLPASMGGNKTPIIDEQALYCNSRPWVEAYHERLQNDITIAQKEVVPNFLRRLTIDEARIIQTFPLEYRFLGSQSSQYTQIGNAVPCNLAKAVCSMVIDVLKGHSPIIYSGLFN